MDFLEVLMMIALAAVVITLGLGLYALHRGGDFGRSYSNKLMRLRVVLQFVAILIIMAAFYAHRR
jgi:hypothetical protein